MPPPRILNDKLVEAIARPGQHKYAVARGTRRLREAFASKYKAAFEIQLDPDKEVCITLGNKDATLHTLMCFRQDRRRALIGIPYYPAHLAAL